MDKQCGDDSDGFIVACFFAVIFIIIAVFCAYDLGRSDAERRSSEVQRCIDNKEASPAICRRVYG